MEKQSMEITREKHLDHLVKVVPLIVMGYGIHSYIILQMNGPMGPNMLLIMGSLIAVMISCFIGYDINHKVVLFDDHLKVHFLGKEQVIYFHEIQNIEVADKEDNFGTAIIYVNNKRLCFYFIDDGIMVKEWIESRKQQSQQAA